MKQITNALAKQFVIPVIRHTDKKTMLNICAALKEGGCKVFEITLMSDAAFSVIRELSKQGLLVGAGTVLDNKAGKLAAQNGAVFLLSPGLCPELAEKSPAPYIPGVMTATEVMRALSFGLDVLKFFPAESSGGVDTIKALSAPFPEVHWMPTGGIEVGSLKKYREAGVLCVGMGGKLFPASEIVAKNWSAMAKRFAALKF